MNTTTNQASGVAEPDDERAKFEAVWFAEGTGRVARRWKDVAERPELLAPHEIGRYVRTTDQTAWEAWQARAALATQPAVPAEVVALAVKDAVQSVVEDIASEWDACGYEGVGETIDIGDAIRRKGLLLSHGAALRTPTQAPSTGAQNPMFTMDDWTAHARKHRWRFDTAEGEAPPAAASSTEPASPAGEVARIVHLRTDRERRVYIAGPMTGLPEYNFPAFNAKAAELRAEGWHVENPAEHGHVDGAGWADYLRWDISRIATCGAIYPLPGWEASKGACLEVHIGKTLGVQFLGATPPAAASSTTHPIEWTPMAEQFDDAAAASSTEPASEELVYLGKVVDGVLSAEEAFVELSGRSAIEEACRFVNESDVTDEQPSSDRDAYEGAREDLLDWKRRALEAEALVRNFVREVNGQTFMGEPSTPTPAVAVPGSLTDEQIMEIAEGWGLDHFPESAKQFAREVLALATTSTAAQPGEAS